MYEAQEYSYHFFKKVQFVYFDIWHPAKLLEPAWHWMGIWFSQCWTNSHRGPPLEVRSFEHMTEQWDQFILF